MENKSKLPTLARRPIQRAHVPSDRIVSSASISTKTIPTAGAKFQVGNRTVLTQNFENVCNMMAQNNAAINRTKPPKRHASPEFRSSNMTNNKKLRRSRSVSDMESLWKPKQPTIPKRPLVPLDTIVVKFPPKRIVSSMKVQRKVTPSVTSTAKKPVPSTDRTIKSTNTTKRIPAYDYKSRFNDLNEKHKVLKEKHDQLRDKMDEYESLPEKYEECRLQLASVQSEIKLSEQKMNQLQQQSAADKLQIQTLTEELNEKKIKLDTVTEENKTLSTQNVQVGAENEALKKHNIELEAELKNNRIEAEEKISELSSQLNDAKEQLYRANNDRKDLHNIIMDLRGNIRVFCRVRPPLPSELNRSNCSWTYHDESSLEVCNIDNKKTVKHDFSFDQVFGPNANQSDVFDQVSPLVQSALDGYNVSIFAYGQTGSGKTYTMDGTANETGIIPRTIDFIFECFEQYRKLGWEYTLCASFLEIYNEIFFDLLSNETKDLDIRMLSAKTPNEIYVSNLTEVNIQHQDELHKLMQMAKINRATAATVGNERSSRSHAVTQLRLIGRHAQRNETCVGTINLIDLAGSESPKTSVRMDETKKINKSLSELTNVIMALLQKQEHVPYRNSKLTHLLMPSLGGNSKTLMFVNVSPFQDCFVESVKSLRFAASVNQCKLNKAKKNKCYSGQITQT